MNISVTQFTKVLHVEVGGSYGGSTRALELYLRYSDRNRFAHDILLFYPTPNTESLASLARNMIVLNHEKKLSSKEYAVRPWTKLKATWIGREFADLRDGIRLLRARGTIGRIANLLHRGKYDVIHVNNTFTYQGPTLLAAKRKRIPLVAHARNPVAYGRFARYLLGLTDLVITVNEELEKQLGSWDVNATIRTCHDAVEPPVIDGPSALALRKELLPCGGVLVGSVGRLDNQKGYHDLIGAARFVVDVRPEVQFVIAGEGPLRPSLEALISELGLESHFRLCGFRSDISNFLAVLDLFVCSSHWEGGPLVVIEAMAAGRSVVSTRVGLTPEVIVPGETGELVTAKEPKALAFAILEALRRSERGEYDVRKAIQVATEWSDPFASARLTDDLLSGVAKQNFV
jgi:glycosyltransferase involved in cell wall biosynthesis